MHTQDPPFDLPSPSPPATVLAAPDDDQSAVVDVFTRSLVADMNFTEVHTVMPMRSPRPWKSTLNTPTFIEKIGDTWLIVDCWHHRVLASTDLELPFEKWHELNVGISDEMIVPHSIATDGQWVVTESSNGGSDGDNHSVLVYSKDPASNLYRHNHTIMACESNRARRPHRIIYHDPSKAFYLYLTNPPHLAKFSSDATGVRQEYCKPIHALKGAYARSIMILDDSIYFTAGPKAITQLDLSTLSLRKYHAIRALKMATGKMNDLAFIDGWWYATSTVKCNIVRFRNLRFENLQILTKQLNLCHDFDRKQKRCTGGTPYYITKIGDRIFVPYIFHCSGVVSFVDDGETISDINHHWGGGWVEQPEDIAVRGTKW